MFNYIILKGYTAPLTKVKVPVRLSTGATVMGYRYKQMSPEEVKQKSKLDSLHFESFRDFDIQMVALDAVNTKLIGNPEKLYWNEKRDGTYVSKTPGAVPSPIEAKVDEYNKHVKEVYDSESSWGISHPSAEHIKKLGAEIGMDYWHDNKVRTTFGEDTGPFFHRLRRDAKDLEGVKFGIDIVNPDVFQREWAASANDSGKFASDLLQAVMATHIPEDSYNVSEGVRVIFDRIAHNKTTAGSQALYDIEEETVRAADLFLAGVYHRTQKILNGLGYEPNDTIILYRGVGASLDKLAEGYVYTNKDYKQNPLSSWTADPGTAGAFGRNVMVAEVRVRDIWSGFFTGMGCKNESEFILPATAVQKFKFFKIREKPTKEKENWEEAVAKSKKVINIDEGLDGEWIRIVEISRKNKVSIEKAKRMFLDRYNKMLKKHTVVKLGKSIKAEMTTIDDMHKALNNRSRKGWPVDEPLKARPGSKPIDKMAYASITAGDKFKRQRIAMLRLGKKGGIDQEEAGPESEGGDGGDGGGE